MLTYVGESNFDMLLDTQSGGGGDSSLRIGRREEMAVDAPVSTVSRDYYSIPQ